MSFDYRDKLSSGRRSMAHLIHVWHERNGWAHKVLPALVDALNLGKLHNSQISNLRNAKLASPSPEVFLALSQANKILDQGVNKIRNELNLNHHDLLRVLEESAVPLMDDDDIPLSAGDFFEIFIGIKTLPSKFDWFIEDEEAALLSAALADFFCDQKSWRYCKDKVMDAYPISNVARREKFALVMAGLRDYTAEEFDGELLDLHKTYITFNNNIDIALGEFLRLLRERAKTQVS